MRIPAFLIALGLVAGGTPFLTTEASAQRQVSSETIVCESVNRQRSECPVRGRIESVRPTVTFSGSPCIQGYSWGYERRNVWVDQGCHASFEVEISRRGGNNANQETSAGGNSITETVDCRSRSFGREECRVEGRIQDVEAVGSFSGAPCRFGSSWGYENRYVWVDQGCEARFNVTFTRRGARPEPQPEPEPEVVVTEPDPQPEAGSSGFFGTGLNSATPEAIIAQGACSGQYTGERGAYIFAVPRTCSKDAPDCNAICSRMARTIENDRLRKLIRSKNPSCFDSVHVYDNAPSSTPGAAGTMTFVYDACGGGCGPNYCCCQAQ